MVGKRDALELVLLGLLADGHVLLDDYPGLAKTLIARSFAQVTSLRFARVQFTPDLMPSDVTGSSIYSQRLGDFEFRPGPVFTNLLLGDEINRSPPKTQAALLEAMQERQVTIDGVDQGPGAPVPGRGHPEPDRVRGHLPAARGPAGPVPDAAVGRLPLGRGRVADAGAPPGTDRRRGRAGPGGDAGRRAGHAAGGRGGPRGRERRPLHRRAGLGDPGQPAGPGRLQPAGQPGPDEGGQGQGRPGRPRLRHPRGRQGGRRPHPGPPAILRPELWVRRVRTEDVVAELLEQVPTPPPEAEPAAVRSRPGR